MLFVKSDNNVKIAVEDLSCKSKRAIVMVHGWPLNNKIYEYQKNLLVEQGWRVVTLDLRGFGKSDAPTWGYSYNQMATDLYHVVSRLNLSNFVLAGFSMGGAIVLRYLGLYNGYGVSKLILLAAAAPSFTKRCDFPYGNSKQDIDQLICQIKSDRPKFAADFTQKLFVSPKSPQVLDWLKEISLAASPIATIQTAIALREEDGREDLKKVCVPTAIFHGMKDMIVPFELGLIQHKEIENSLLYAFENSGHGIFYDELESFNQYFLSFLEK